MNTHQKQDFIGTIIATELAKAGAKKVITTALSRVATAKNTKMAVQDIEPAAQVVEQAIKNDLQAKLEHKLDAEPHYSSRNVWGAFVGLVCAADVIYKMWTDDVTNDVMDYVTQFGMIASILTPLYSRFIAKKPLFK